MRYGQDLRGTDHGGEYSRLSIGGRFSELLNPHHSHNAAPQALKPGEMGTRLALERRVVYQSPRGSAQRYTQGSRGGEIWFWL